MWSVLAQAAQAAGKYLIEKFIVHGLVAAVALPMTLLSVSSLIDSQWTVVSLPCTLAAKWNLFQHDVGEPAPCLSALQLQSKIAGGKTCSYTCSQHRYYRWLQLLKQPGKLV